MSAIDTGHVTNILQPIWAVKPETASRVRGRIEAVLDYAKVHGWRSRDAANPAAWKGNLALCAAEAIQGPQGGTPCRPALA